MRRGRCRISFLVKVNRPVRLSRVDVDDGKQMSRGHVSGFAR